MNYSIAVAHHAGGVGKTTTTINIGYWLAREGFRVRLVDLDPQGDMSGRLNVEPIRPTLAEALIDQRVQPHYAVLDWEGANVAVLPSNLDMAATEPRLMVEQMRERRLLSVLRATESAYDYTLIDCPPSLSVLTLNALHAANGVLIPVQAQDKAYRALDAVLETIGTVNYFRETPLEIVGILVTMMDNTTMARDVVQMLRSSEQFGRYVFAETVPSRTLARADSRYRAPVSAYAPTDASSVAYHAVAQEVMRRTDVLKGATL